MHIPGILAIAVLRDLLKSRQKVTDKPPSSAAREFHHAGTAHGHGVWALLCPLPVPSVSFSFESLGQCGFKLCKSKTSDRLSQGHSSSAAPRQLCRTTSTQLCRHHLICILGRSYRAPVKIWPYPEQTKKLRKIITQNANSTPERRPFIIFIDKSGGSRRGRQAKELTCILSPNTAENNDG